jgi:hypothetical protein
MPFNTHLTFLHRTGGYDKLGQAARSQSHLQMQAQQDFAIWFQSTGGGLR